MGANWHIEGNKYFAVYEEKYMDAMSLGKCGKHGMNLSNYKGVHWARAT